MCPVTYDHPNETVALGGIGERIAARLTKALQKHCDENGENMPQEGEPPQIALLVRAWADTRL